MRRLSSNMTIILKVFVPIFYITFFGSLLIGSLIVSINDAPLVGSSLFRAVFAAVFFTFVALLYFTVIKLKRVDADEDYIYINNYIKTYRYKWEDIEKLKTRSYGLFTTITVSFRAKTSLGKRVVFLASTPLVKDFMKNNERIFLLMQDA